MPMRTQIGAQGSESLGLCLACGIERVFLVGFWGVGALDVGFIDGLLLSLEDFGSSVEVSWMIRAPCKGIPAL